MSIPIRIALIALLFLSACGGSEPTKANSTPCPTSPPIERSSPFLKKFPLDTFGTVVGLQSKNKYVSLTAVSDSSVVELHPRIAREVMDRGYTIVGADNEGFESEIYFALKGRFTGIFRLREGPCRDQVTVTLLYLKEPSNADIPPLPITSTPSQPG